MEGNSHNSPISVKEQPESSTAPENASTGNVEKETKCEIIAEPKTAENMDTHTGVADVDDALVKSEPSEVSVTSIAQPDAVESEKMDDCVKIKTENEINDTQKATGAVAADAELEETSDTEKLSKTEAELCPREVGFTSEKFKIEISGLPKRFGFKVLSMT